MKYEKPDVKVEKFTFQPILLEEPISSIDPEPTKPGPVIEENDPFYELANAYDNIFDFTK